MDLPYKDYKEILLKILETIGYTDDKEAFVNQFASNIYSQSLIDLIQSLSPSNQEKIKQELNAVSNTQEQIEEIVKKYFTEEQRKTALEDTVEKVMIDYLSSIQSSLSPSQEENLINLFQKN